MIPHSKYHENNDHHHLIVVGIGDYILTEHHQIISWTTIPFILLETEYFKFQRYNQVRHQRHVIIRVLSLYLHPGLFSLFDIKGSYQISICLPKI